MSDALVESTKAKLRVLHRMAFGLAEPEHLIARALLDLGGDRPPLQSRWLRKRPTDLAGEPVKSQMAQDSRVCTTNVG